MKVGRKFAECLPLSEIVRYLTHNFDSCLLLCTLDKLVSTGDIRHVQKLAEHFSH